MPIKTKTRPDIRRVDSSHRTAAPYLRPWPYRLPCCTMP